MDIFVKKNNNGYCLIKNGVSSIINSEQQTTDELPFYLEIPIKNIDSDFDISFSDSNIAFPEPCYFLMTKRGDILNVSISFEIIYAEWDFACKVKELLSTLKTITTQQNVSFDVISGEGYSEYLDFTWMLENGCASDIFEDVKNKSTTLISEALLHNHKRNGEKVISKIFSFPDECKVICCQYLMWFGEFLSGLGITANISSNNHVNGDTEITISSIPDDTLKNDIEILFHQYLKVPFIDNISIDNTSLSLQQRLMQQSLIIQIEHFKNQLLLKDSVIELKNSSISSLQGRISRYESENILSNSLNEEKDINLLNGGIKIGDFKWLGVTVSTKKIVEAISNAIQKEK